MVQTTSKHVFISYSRKDNDVMRRIVLHLREQGIRAWVDNEYLTPGTRVWENEIERAIINAFAVVVVLSPDAKNSEWVLREITLADEYQKQVFPIIVSGRNIDSIPFRLVTRQFADMRSNELDGLHSLSGAVYSYWNLLVRIEEEQKAKEEAERLAKEAAEEAELISQQKAEQERLQKLEGEKKAQEKSDRIAQQKAEQERLAQAKREAERKAKEDADRIAKEKAAAELLAKLEAEKKAQEAADRLAQQKVEQEKLTRAKLEAEREAKKLADRLAMQKAEEERLAEPKVEDQKGSIDASGLRKDDEERKATTVAKGKRLTVGKEVEQKPISPLVGQISRTTSTQSTEGSPFARIGVSKSMAAWLAVGAVAVCALSVTAWGLSTMLNSFTPTPTDNPAVDTPAPDSPTATEEPAAESTPTEDASLPQFSGKSLVAPNCDTGNLIKSIEATDRYTVTFNLCKPDAAFLAKTAISTFSIYPEEWLENTISSESRSSEALEHPVGTGPYMVSSWQRGDSITFSANPDYWGNAPAAETLVFRWSSESAQRLLELQSGTVDAIDTVPVEDYGVVQADNKLSLQVRPALNIFFIGINNGVAPFDDQRVRQALAMGIDRQRIVDKYFPLDAEVASHFTPCAIQNGCNGESWYEFDPEAAKQLLAEAGYPNGFSAKLFYRDVYRLYLPNAAEVAQEIQVQLREFLNIEIDLVVLDSGAYFDALAKGQLDGLFMLGWGANYPHITDFLDNNFSSSNNQFGDTPYTVINQLIEQGARTADAEQASSIYAQANTAIKESVPMIPISHNVEHIAYRADVAVRAASSLWLEKFALAEPNGRNTFVWMDSAEPASLFCADESDASSLRACSQVMETLYGYRNSSADVDPLLAEECKPNEDLTTWVCSLRKGVLFHDGTGFDANDVVATFTMGLDALSPLHVGNTNGWDYYNYIFGPINSQ